MPPDGILPPSSPPEVPDEFNTKFPWFRISPGELAVDTTRLGETESVEGSVPDGYGQTGFNPSRLVFDGEGFWEVAGQIGDKGLTFIVWVCPTEDFAETVSTADREACGAA